MYMYKHNCKKRMKVRSNIYKICSTLYRYRFIMCRFADFKNYFSADCQFAMKSSLHNRKRIYLRKLNECDHFAKERTALYDKSDVTEILYLCHHKNTFFHSFISFNILSIRFGTACQFFLLKYTSVCRM